MKINLVILLLLFIKVNSNYYFLNSDCVKDEIKVINFLDKDKIICNSTKICPSAIFCSRYKMTNIWRCGSTNINKYSQIMRIEFKKCDKGIIKGSGKIYIEDYNNGFNYIVLLIIIYFLGSTYLKDNKIVNFFNFMITGPSIYDWVLLLLYLIIFTDDNHYNLLVHSNTI